MNWHNKNETKSVHHEIKTNVFNYYLNNNQELFILPNSIIQKLQEKELINKGKKHTLAEKFKNYQMFFIDKQIHNYHKQNFFIAIPKTPISIPIIKPEQPNEIIQNLNNKKPLKELNDAKLLLFSKKSNYKIEIYTSWLEITLNKEKVVNVMQQHCSLENINSNNYFSTYAKRSDGKIGFLWAKLLSNQNTDQLKNYLKKFKK